MADLLIRTPVSGAGEKGADLRLPPRRPQGACPTSGTPASGAAGTVGAVADGSPWWPRSPLAPAELVFIGLRRGGPVGPHLG